MKKVEKNGVVYFVFENIEAAGIVRHGFSSRIGGVSQGYFASMNLGKNRGDSTDNVEKNYQLFCDAIGCDVDSIVRLNQQHSTIIMKIDESPPIDAFGDGLVTNTLGQTLMTYYADCVSLLLCDPVKRVIANCHAGWRGTAYNMAGEAIKKMTEEYGCNPYDILVGIGPSISCKNFEVGAEVVQEFKESLPFSADFVYNSEINKNKYHIDLWGINRQSFIMAGLQEENIEIAGMCTFDDETHFYSHRRDGSNRGSLAAVIQLI
ncbi:MAG: peptidoglycan editing factor PgeF [Defluviitaleaceae bacterium]|nr:peptidoglycan editing factor PgeF [Defluviitaleaceae bacterium]